MGQQGLGRRLDPKPSADQNSTDDQHHRVGGNLNSKTQRRIVDKHTKGRKSSQNKKSRIQTKDAQGHKSQPKRESQNPPLLQGKSSAQNQRPGPGQQSKGPALH